MDIKNGITLEGVTNGDTHDHSGGDGGQVDHGGLNGLSDDDHTQYLLVNDSAILTVNGTYLGKTATVTVDDASAAFSNALYIAADFHYERALADAIATMPVVALAVQAGAGAKLVLKRGQICNTSWDWSAGIIYADPATAGIFTQTAADFDTTDMVVQIVGHALSADTIWFDPSEDYLEIA
jgi:hypothetical protein